MKRILWIIGLLLLAILLLGAVGATVVLNGWHIKKHTPAELALVVVPYFETVTPEGDGPFPTVVAFHGCGGVVEANFMWADSLAAQGYATVLVDSFTGRDQQRDPVCNGYAFWGSERAGDVAIALEAVRRLPFVQADQLALMGWSHGAWAIMDFLAMVPDERPTNLKALPDDPLAGIQATVLFYPYCAFPARTDADGWNKNVPTLMLLAGGDTYVPTDACLEAAAYLEATGVPLQMHTYPDANHAFDESDDVLAPPLRHHPAATADAHQRIGVFLGDIFGTR